MYKGHHSLELKIVNPRSVEKPLLLVGSLPERSQSKGRRNNKKKEHKVIVTAPAS